jgi:serine/threonine protein kinase
MNAANIVHPSSETLRAFGLGQLDSFSADPVRRHLESCPDCRRQVGEDAGYTPFETPGPNRPLSDSSHTSPARAGQKGGALPAELASNPQYDILRELGRGGMGVVYLAKNKLMDRPEVLKVISRNLMDRPGSVERFLREIRSAAMLNHDNVVKAYNAFQIGELLVFAMEYVEGENLAELIKAQGPLAIPKACHYMCQVALGLQAAHDKAMVHRDIKPQNLILAHEGKKHVVKILDFGLAKATSQDRLDEALTGDGKMLGTPDFIAPEQTLDAAHADIRADIYSLGCTLYYLLTGAPPFQGGSIFELLQAHQSKDARLLNLVRPDVPLHLAAIVAKMMAKDPAKRYQRPGDVAEALLPFLHKPAKVPVVAAATEKHEHIEQTARHAAVATARVPAAKDTGYPVGIVRQPAGVVPNRRTRTWMAALAAGLVLLLLLGLLLVLIIAVVFVPKSRFKLHGSWRGHFPLHGKLQDLTYTFYPDGDMKEMRYDDDGQLTGSGAATYTYADGRVKITWYTGEVEEGTIVVLNDNQIRYTVTAHSSDTSQIGAEVVLRRVPD